MIELLLLLVAWVDSPEGWQQYDIFIVGSYVDMWPACKNTPYYPSEDPDPIKVMGCTHGQPTRQIYLWYWSLYYPENYSDRWGCDNVLWHELLHAYDYEYGRPNWHGGSLRMSNMPCNR